MAPSIELIWKSGPKKIRCKLMAIIQAVIAALARFAGKILNTLFGWATTTLFGKVPQEKQNLLSVMSLGSVVWIALLVGVLWPDAGFFLLSFVTLPEWVQDHWVRMVMVAAAILLPAGIGLLSTRVTDLEDQPKGLKETVQRILHGYPYAVATSLALIMMIVFVPLLKTRTLIKRWTTEHLPMIVEDQDYVTVVTEIEQALGHAGYPVIPTQASILLRLPVKVLIFFAGKRRSRLVSDQLTTLRSDRVELILHPSDLVISGGKYDVAHVRAIVAEQLAFSPSYMTWTKEANELEDRLGAIWDTVKATDVVRGQSDLAQQLQQIEHDLRSAKIGYEEWEILLREKLLVERAVLQLATGLVDQAREPAEMDEKKLGTGAALSNAPTTGEMLVRRGLVVVGAVLGLWIVSRKSSGS
jgi:hypothetical protein